MDEETECLLMDKDVSTYFYGVKEDVSVDYKDLAFFLGIEDTRNIESRNPDAKSCCMDVLQTWKRTKGDEATVEVLLQALVSAELGSAADNLRRKLGNGDQPTPSTKQINVKLPETRENAGSENGSFSCKILNCLDISCICCDYKVWLCILYAICLIFRPYAVVILTIAVVSLTIVVYVIVKVGGKVRESIHSREEEDDDDITYYMYIRKDLVEEVNFNPWWTGETRVTKRFSSQKNKNSEEFASHQADQMVA